MDEERAAFPAATYPTGIVPNTTFVNVATISKSG